MPSSPPQELRHTSDTPGDGRATCLQDASPPGRASAAATENPELPTVPSTQSARPGSSEMAARPKKKYKPYKSTIYSDERAPKFRGRPPAVQTQPNAMSEADFPWLMRVVYVHDQKKKRGNKGRNLYEMLKTRLAHLDEHVLMNHIKQARRRIELKEQQQQKARDEAARVRRDADEAKARLEQEVEAKKKLAADASALAEENTKLVAQWKSLEAAVRAQERLQIAVATEQGVTAEASAQATTTLTALVSSLQEAIESQTRLEQEVAAKEKLAAEASALAEENTKLVAQCKCLEEAVDARDAAVAKAKHDLEEQQKRAVEETSSSYTSTIEELKTKIQEQDQQVQTQQETLRRQEQASQTLREQISGSKMAQKELEAANEKLAKAEAANLELSQVLGPKLKELGQLKTQLQAAEATLARQQRQHQVQLEQAEMQLRIAEEQRDEAFSSLDLFSRASKVEFELKKLKMAASCAYNEDARFKSRSKSPFEDDPFWNNASMTDMALRVIEARGADTVQVNRFRKLFKRWRDVRNDISHSPDAYTKYVVEANDLKRDMDALCEAVAPAIIAMSDSSGSPLLSSVVSFVVGKQQEFKKKMRG